MTRFEFLVHNAVRLRQANVKDAGKTATEVGQLYEERKTGHQVAMALSDAFFPLSLFAKYHLNHSTCENVRIERAAQDLALLSRMFLKIRKDIDRYFGNSRVTCIDLGGDALQDVPSGQWCSFCGECCQLTGTVPDPAPSIKYPGYWYAYIAGDSPLRQRFCPFLFELPPQNLFFCSIHNVKPLTCLAYGERDCREKHPGSPRGT
jgi:hypothetical protein